jgi:predicted amidohydrolase
VPPIPHASLRVAAIQAEPNPGDVGGNVAVAARLASRAAGEGARLAVLPELFIPGYHPPTLHKDPAGTEVVADESGKVSDIRLDRLRAVATDQKIVIVVSAAVRHTDGRRTISALLVDRRGGISCVYDKQHLSGPDERELFSAGSEGATLAVDGWWLGLAICYDTSFPEHGRAAADDGAHGYVCMTAYFDGSQHRRDLHGAARALDNTMYVVVANQVGGPSPWRSNGGSAIYEPEGRPLRRAPDFGEHVIIADFDRDELHRIRTAHPMLDDRRVDLGPRRRLCRG